MVPFYLILYERKYLSGLLTKIERKKSSKFEFTFYVAGFY